MQQIKNIVKGPYEPQDNTVMWIDTSNPDAPIAKVHSNGEWRPQIAQQEYLTIVGKTINDAELYAGLAKAIQAGTIFDAVIQYLNGDGYVEKDRIITHVFDGNGHALIYYNGTDTELARLNITETPSNYEALAAVQRGGYGYDDTLPTMTVDSLDGKRVLKEDNNSVYIVCNGKAVVVSLDNKEKIVSIETSNVSIPDGNEVYSIEESDLPNFIGLTTF